MVSCHENPAQTVLIEKLYSTPVEPIHQLEEEAASAAEPPVCPEGHGQAQIVSIAMCKEVSWYKKSSSNFHATCCH
jgi:hypothetical protein